ncbi:MAG: prepilin-type N-terminal cleavage/methylation domain-containing protein [Phycisphaerales bacterium]
MRAGGTLGKRAFSLLELVIVAAIIAVIVAIVAPRVGGMTERSKIAAVGETVRNVQNRVDQEFEIERAYPTSVQPSWFAGGNLTHAMFPGVAAAVEVVNDPAVAHPVIRFSTGATPVFWYNRGNGAFRARVPAQATAAETRALYRKVNGVPGLEVHGTGGGGNMPNQAQIQAIEGPD